MFKSCHCIGCFKISSSVLAVTGAINQSINQCKKEGKKQTNEEHKKRKYVCLALLIQESSLAATIGKLIFLLPAINNTMMVNGETNDVYLAFQMMLRAKGTSICGAFVMLMTHRI